MIHIRKPKCRCMYVSQRAQGPSSQRPRDDSLVQMTIHRIKCVHSCVETKKLYISRNKFDLDR